MISRSEPAARFRAGDLVEHLRYGYRGVVVEVDFECRASDAWYLRNQTQPRRDQPWYSVLVDGALHETYVAESNLRADSTGGPVDHPGVAEYFSEFLGGRYLRNGKPWTRGE